MTWEIELPWPPTGNHYYTVARGRKILSDDGRIYQSLAAGLIRLVRPVLNPGRIAVEIDAHVPDWRRRDLDNLQKGILDCLQAGGVYADDGQIDDLRIRRFPVCPGGKVVVRVWELEPVVAKPKRGKRT